MRNLKLSFTLLSSLLLLNACFHEDDDDEPSSLEKFESAASVAINDSSSLTGRWVARDHLIGSKNEDDGHESSELSYDFTSIDTWEVSVSDNEVRLKSCNTVTTYPLTNEGTNVVIPADDYIFDNDEAILLTIENNQYLRFSYIESYEDADENETSSQYFSHDVIAYKVKEIENNEVGRIFIDGEESSIESDCFGYIGGSENFKQTRDGVTKSGTATINYINTNIGDNSGEQLEGYFRLSKIIVHGYGEQSEAAINIDTYINAFKSDFTIFPEDENDSYGSLSSTLSPSEDALKYSGSFSISNDDGESSAVSFEIDLLK